MKSHQFRFPKPPVWHRIHEELVQKNSRGDKPPVPLILGGWHFSSADQKNQRWAETVHWAKERGLDTVIELSADDYYSE